jgi:hypothetical protein
MAQGKWEEVENKLTLVTAWARDGLTNEDICKNLGINVATLYRYKQIHGELCEALKNGKEIIDVTVENALYKRTQGFRYDEVTKENMPVYDDEGKLVGYELKITKVITKEVLPDPVSCFFWLKNRRKDQWRDKREIENVVEVKVPMLNEVMQTFQNMRMLNKAEVIDIDIDDIDQATDTETIE